MVGRPVMVVVVAKGHSGERKKREDCAEKNRGRGWFFFIFGPEFPLPQAIKSTYIYRQWKRTIFLHWRKIAALDSDGKDPNCWLKVDMVHCQIVKSAVVGYLSWPFWGGATSVYLPFSR